MTKIQLTGRGTVAYQWTGNGPRTVVLVNGSVFNYFQWDKVLPLLRHRLGKQYRFLRYDYVGVGGSSAKTVPFNMLDLADELRDLLDALSVERVHLLGISKGSLVGQAFLFRHPERALSFCGLGNPNLLYHDLNKTFAVFRERVEELEKMEELWPQRIHRRNYARVFREVYVPALFSKRYTELSMKERLRAFVVRQIVYSSLKGTFIRTMADLFRYYIDGIIQEIPAFADGLSRIHGVPILLLHGNKDTTIPIEMSRGLVKKLSGAELVEFEGVTHMGPLLLKKESELVFGRYVDFLKQVDKGK